MHNNNEQLWLIWWNTLEGEEYSAIGYHSCFSVSMHLSSHSYVIFVQNFNGALIILCLSYNTLMMMLHTFHSHCRKLCGAVTVNHPCVKKCQCRNISADYLCFSWDWTGCFQFNYYNTHWWQWYSCHSPKWRHTAQTHDQLHALFQYNTALLTFCILLLKVQLLTRVFQYWQFKVNLPQCTNKINNKYQINSHHN